MEEVLPQDGFVFFARLASFWAYSSSMGYMGILPSSFSLKMRPY